MVATLARSGSNSFTMGNQRSYDVWGSIRGGSSTGAPNTRYCANLGHKQDDESGLIYMRARYYEPGTGRFVSEDPTRNGWNWFAYCGNDPIQNVDYNGGIAWALVDLLGLLMMWAGGATIKLNPVVGGIILGVGIVVTFIGVMMTINELTSKIEQQKQKMYDRMRPYLSERIDEIKSSGNGWAEKFGAHTLEIYLYLWDIEWGT